MSVNVAFLDNVFRINILVMFVFAHRTPLIHEYNVKEKTLFYAFFHSFRSGLQVLNTMIMWYALVVLSFTGPLIRKFDDL